jgi:hypothetical protein
VWLPLRCHPSWLLVSSTQHGICRISGVIDRARQGKHTMTDLAVPITPTDHMQGSESAL